jgi:hypothetical protein
MESNIAKQKRLFLSFDILISIYYGNNKVFEQKNPLIIQKKEKKEYLYISSRDQN